MFRKSLFVLVIFIFSFFISEIKAQSLSQSISIPEDLKITLETSACFGECPIYKLTIKSDGVVIFEGKEYTKIVGKADAKISQEQIKELINKFEKVKFFSLRDSYVSEEDGCTENFTDMPSITISIQMNGKRKYSSFYLGCSGKAEKYGKRIIEVSNKINEVTNAKQWVKE